MQCRTEFVVLGSGFAGSLLALILARQGRRVVLVDRGRHPRFAIGESSTPLANLVLRDLAQRYDLPEIGSLTRYGSWRRTHPELVCGLKRGFSYFHLGRDSDFHPTKDHQTELLVAASSEDELADTHWLRADVDHFFVRQAEGAGVTVLQQTNLTTLSYAPRSRGAWELAGDSPAGDVRITADFVCDASGEGAVLPRALKLADRTRQLATNTRGVFGHFRGLKSWHQLAADRKAQVQDYPFPSDAAAQHILLEGAWMWVLRFSNGVTSAGLSLDTRQHPLDPALDPQEEWNEWLKRYAVLREMFRGSELVDPPGRIVRSGRMQRQWYPVAGPHWALLPHTAGFIDPLHSTGIAHSLYGIERLAGIFERHSGSEGLAAVLEDYVQAQARELQLIDRLVASCFATLRFFPAFVASTMLYFAAVTHTERARLAGQGGELGYLSAGDPGLQERVAALAEMARRLGEEQDGGEAVQEFRRRVAAAMAPYNHVGLFEPPLPNMYRHTAVM